MSDILSEWEERRILRLYHKGLSCRKIAQKTDRSRIAVKRVLSDNGLKAMSSLDRSRKYTISADYFSNIDSHKKAYWLGWIMADGCMRRNKGVSNVLRFTIGYRDRAILEEFRKDIGSNAPVTYTTRYLKKRRRYAWFTACNTQMVNDLERYGIVQAKSILGDPPKNIPEQYLSSFVLGYFEGDGCLYVPELGANARFSIWDQKAPCEFLKRCVSSVCSRSVGTIYKKRGSNVWVYAVSKHEDLAKIYAWMYGNKDFSWCLERKHKKWLRYFDEKRARRERWEARKTSKYIGVHRVKYGKQIKYCAKVQYKTVLYTVGHYDSEYDAAIARDRKAIELMGEKAVVNF